MVEQTSVFATINNRDMLVCLVVFFTLVAMQWYKKLPEPWTIKHYLSALNDRGGNILVLAFGSAWFFSVSVKTFFHFVNLIVEKKLEPDNAIVLMGVQFVSSSAFGSCFGALLKTMTGSDSMTRGTDGAPGSRVTSQTTIRTDVATPPAKITDVPVVPAPEEAKGS